MFDFDLVRKEEEKKKSKITLTKTLFEQVKNGLNGKNIVIKTEKLDYIPETSVPKLTFNKIDVIDGNIFPIDDNKLLEVLNLALATIVTAEILGETLIYCVACQFRGNRHRVRDYTIIICTWQSYYWDNNIHHLPCGIICYRGAIPTSSSDCNCHNWRFCRVLVDRQQKQRQQQEKKQK